MDWSSDVWSSDLAVFVFPMSEDLGWSRTTIVGAASAAGIAAMFVSPLAGWVQQRFGPRVLLTGSMLLLGGALMSLRWAEGFVLLYQIGTASCRERVCLFV